MTLPAIAALGTLIALVWAAGELWAATRRHKHEPEWRRKT